jgi:hypothetical protein
MVMKNIHILPTDKPSRLSIIDSQLIYSKEYFINPQNIYITSDEEIKEGDWFYDGDSELCKYTSDYVVNPNGWNDNKKIILTTDQDLIKDGVQDIDDEFLEWFIKNPSCEEGEVDKNWNYPLDKSWEYKIIIPKEEQKQHLIDIMRGDEELGLYEEPKQETLEEAALNYSKQFLSTQEYDFKEGAKWQQERMYSKEDLRTAWMAAKNSSDFNEWFEQYKKK